MPHLPQEPIAIIGMGCRFPGKANDPEAYWELLRMGTEALVQVPSNRWDIDSFFDPDRDAPGKMIQRQAGFLEFLDDFDPEFFGISPTEAASLDPQHRLLLEVGWEALEDAGISPDRLAESATGVFIGMSGTDFRDVLMRQGPEKADAYLGTGIAPSMASGRLSHFLRLLGPSLTVDTACSSSLVAVHLACQSLRENECDLALAGGVNRILSPELSISLSKNRLLSPSGRCRSFSSAADGFVRGEGAGIIVLKRLSDAIQHRDPIVALVRGTAVNHGGRTAGSTTPNGTSQQAVIRKALENAGVSPEEVDYIEAHGFGSPLGDPIEVGALASVYCRNRSAAQPLWIGSVKGNIGHLEAASGIAGLMKAVLALRHRTIPPHLNFDAPSPRIPWEIMPVAVAPVSRDWPESRKPRRAGVSAFGFSGTNAHVILEEPPRSEPDELEGDRPWQVLTLSARTEGALQILCRTFLEYLARSPNHEFGHVCHTLNTGRAGFDQKLCLVVASREEASRKLRDYLEGWSVGDVFAGHLELLHEPRVAFLFSGETSRLHGRGAELIRSLPVFRATMQECDRLARPWLDESLLELLHGEGAEARLRRPRVAFAALFALQAALCRLWRECGVEPAAVLGQGIGEYVAAWAAGVFSMEDGLRLAIEQGRLWETLGLDATPLQAPGVAASGEAWAGFERTLQEIHFSPPNCPWVSEMSGTRASATPVTSGYWVARLTAPSQFEEGLARLCEKQFSQFLELGPGDEICRIVKERFSATAPPAWPSLGPSEGEWLTLLRSAAALEAHGLKIDWEKLDRPLGYRRMNGLPHSPFLRHRCWPDLTNTAHPSAPIRACAHPLLERVIRSPLATSILFESDFHEKSTPLLKDYRL